MPSGGSTFAQFPQCPREVVVEAEVAWLLSLSPWGFLPLQVVEWCLQLCLVVDLPHLVRSQPFLHSVPAPIADESVAAPSEGEAEPSAEDAPPEEL